MWKVNRCRQYTSSQNPRYNIHDVAASLRHAMFSGQYVPLYLLTMAIEWSLRDLIGCGTTGLSTGSGDLYSGRCSVRSAIINTHSSGLTQSLFHAVLG